MIDPRPLNLNLMPPTMRKILLEVCYKHDVHPQDLAGKETIKRYYVARREFFCLSRKAGYSYPRIGKAINKDHSTVMHAVQMSEGKNPDEWFKPFTNHETKTNLTIRPIIGEILDKSNKKDTGSGGATSAVKFREETLMTNAICETSYPNTTSSDLSNKMSYLAQTADSGL